MGGWWWVAECVGSERLKVGSGSGVSGAVVAAVGKVRCLRLESLRLRGLEVGGLRVAGGMGNLEPLRARFWDLVFMVWVVLGGEELLCWGAVGLGIRGSV